VKVNGEQAPAVVRDCASLGWGATMVGVVIDYCDRHQCADVLTRPERPGRHPGAAPAPRRWHLRGPREKQAAMTEPSGVRLAADPRGFSERLPALGRI
jgi:hypothetical protein